MNDKQNVNKGGDVMNQFSINPKFYRYNTGAIHLKTRKQIKDAVRIGLRITRLDRLMDEVEFYDYATNSFKKLL